MASGRAPQLAGTAPPAASFSDAKEDVAAGKEESRCCQRAAPAGLGGLAALTQAGLAPPAAHLAPARWGMGGQPLEGSASRASYFGSGMGVGAGHASSRDTGVI